MTIRIIDKDNNVSYLEETENVTPHQRQQNDKDDAALEKELNELLEKKKVQQNN